MRVQSLPHSEKKSACNIPSIMTIMVAR